MNTNRRSSRIAKKAAKKAQKDLIYLIILLMNQIHPQKRAPSLFFLITTQIISITTRVQKQIVFYPENTPNFIKI